MARSVQRKPWTADEDETVRINYPRFPAFLIAHVLGRTPLSVHQRAKTLYVEKAADFWRQWHVPLWHAHASERSRAARFRKGQVPPNKGLRRPGYAPGRMAQTQFKKGQMSGAAQHNYVPIGTEKIDPKRNVLMRKTTDDPSIFPVKRWRPVHVIVWEAANGAVPRGHIVVFKRGLKTFKAVEITVDRLELVTLAENMRRNTIHRYPAEIKDAMRLIGRVKRAARKRHEEQD